jgi:hypothetical protein
MSHAKPDEVYSAEERAVMLDAMKRASNAFYAAAVKIQNHPFIEFAGLMNEVHQDLPRSSTAGDRLHERKCA